MTVTASAGALDHALAYAARGWRVVPIRPGAKYPAVERWQEVATTDAELIRQWWGSWPDHGVGIATGERSGVFVLDVDCAEGKVGFESLRELEALHGPLPATVEAITGTGGRHLFFRHPPGLDLSNSAGRLGVDLDIRANGGQVVAAPTAHPVTGSAYCWDLDHHPDDTAVADAPAWLLKLLTPPPKADVGPRGDYERALLAVDRYNYSPRATDAVAAMLAQAGWREGRPDRTGARYFTRPGKDRGIGATLGRVAPGVLFCFTSSAPPLEAERSYDPFDVLTALAFAGDRVAADRWLVEQSWGIASHSISPEDLEAWVAAGSQAPTPEAQAQALGLWLPEDFWGARAQLAHIRQAARSRLVAADAVLGAVLARIAACTPHTVELPAIVGSPVGLTFFAAPVGSPESGKSTAAAVAAELVPAPAHVLDRLPIGSGEGFVEVLFEMTTEIDDEGKKRVVKKQTKHAAIFHIDEGTVLGDLSQRSGSTLMPTLRSAFTHGTIGATNASAERKRTLHGHTYVYGVTMGIQPELAGPLLGDMAAGTPQRFVWLMASDPLIGDEPVPWPGALDWEPPSGQVLDVVASTSGAGWRRHPMHVLPEIRAEVRADRLDAMRGAAERDQGDAHRMLVRLKVGALLGLLDGRVGIDLEDWRLAGIVVDTSRRVRHAVEGAISHVQRRSEQAITDRHVRRELTIEDSRERRALQAAARAVGKVVARHHDAGDHQGQGCARRCLTLAIASRDRAVVSVDDATAEAEASGWVTGAMGGRWAPGRSRPA